MPFFLSFEPTFARNLSWGKKWPNTPKKCICHTKKWPCHLYGGKVKICVARSLKRVTRSFFKVARSYEKKDIATHQNDLATTPLVRWWGKKGYPFYLGQKWQRHLFVGKDMEIMWQGHNFMNVGKWLCHTMKWPRHTKKWLRHTMKWPRHTKEWPCHENCGKVIINCGEVIWKCGKDTFYALCSYLRPKPVMG
jgi:hypothetical protein